MAKNGLDWKNDDNWGYSLAHDLLLTGYLFEDTHFSIARERIRDGISPPSLMEDHQAVHQQRVQEITAKWLAKWGTNN